MKNTSFITIPKVVTGKEELVVLPRKTLEKLLENRIKEEELLRWSREAKKMSKEGTLPVLRSLRDLR